MDKVLDFYEKTPRQNPPFIHFGKRARNNTSAMLYLCIKYEVFFNKKWVTRWLIRHFFVLMSDLCVCVCTVKNL